MSDLSYRLVKGKHGGRGFELDSGQLNRSDDVLTFLRTRRSTPAADIHAPGPDERQLSLMLEAACRVPDHGKLTPWRFIVLQNEGREAYARFLALRWRALHPDESGGATAPEADFARRVPLLVVVVSRTFEHPKIPRWEQRLSAGAVCHNLLLAATAQGFAAQWRSGWPAYDEETRHYLGIAPQERIAGIIHIGTRKANAAPLADRRRPFWQDLTTFFTGDDESE